MNWILEKVKQISDWCSWSFLSIQGVFWVLCDVDCGAVKFESRQMVAVKWPNFIAAAFVLASRKKKSWDLPVPYQISCSVSIMFLMKTIGVFGCLATSLMTSLWLLNVSDKGYRYLWFYGWRSFSSHTIFVQRTSCSAKWKIVASCLRASAASYLLWHGHLKCMDDQKAGRNLLCALWRWLTSHRHLQNESFPNESTIVCYLVTRKQIRKCLLNVKLVF